MQLIVEPSLDRWQLDASLGGNEIPTRDIEALNERLLSNANQWGTARPRQGGAFIATGHQAWLWHPGILAKDLAVMAACDRFGAGAFHVVVDQDINPALHLELPVVRDGLLAVEVIQLGPSLESVPTGFQPAVEPNVIQQNLLKAQHDLGRALAVDLAPLIEGFQDLPECRSLAQQITVAMDRMRQKVSNRSMPILFASDLAEMPFYQNVLKKILGDARGCVASYNRAVNAFGSAGIALLRVEPDRVELPLWALTWGKPRQRVFADLGGDSPLLTIDNGDPIDLEEKEVDSEIPRRFKVTLGPKALLLTAVLRRWCCNLFVHGLGGDVYDRVTEHWWQGWLGETLSPMAVVSADLFMDFDVSVADGKQLERAIWMAHHVAHNVDRIGPIDALDRQAVAKKRQLLEHMDLDRDPVRRAAAFLEIHRINDVLVRAAPTLLSEVQSRLNEAKNGVANRLVASKRDWCFGLYDRSILGTMATAIAVH